MPWHSRFEPYTRRELELHPDAGRLVTTFEALLDEELEALRLEREDTQPVDDGPSMIEEALTDIILKARSCLPEHPEKAAKILDKAIDASFYRNA